MPKAVADPIATSESIPEVGSPLKSITTRRGTLQRAAASFVALIHLRASAVAAPAPAVDPDAELIQSCMGIHAASEAIDRLCDEISEQDELNEAAAPFQSAWREHRSRLFELKPPTTDAGARAIAYAMLAHLPTDSLDWAINDDDIDSWLAIGLARYLTGMSEGPRGIAPPAES